MPSNDARAFGEALRSEYAKFLPVAELDARDHVRAIDRALARLPQPEPQRRHEWENHAGSERCRVCRTWDDMPEANDPCPGAAKGDEDATSVQRGVPTRRGGDADSVVGVVAPVVAPQPAASHIDLERFAGPTGWLTPHAEAQARIAELEADAVDTLATYQRHTAAWTRRAEKAEADLAAEREAHEATKAANWSATQKAASLRRELDEVLVDRQRWFDAAQHNAEVAEQRLATAPATAVESATGGVALIAAERQRQMDKEGWTPQHDDEHGDLGLAMAATCYLDLNRFPAHWPFEQEAFKPRGYLDNLVRADALVAAEIDRVTRATPAAPAPAPTAQPATQGPETLADDPAAVHAFNSAVGAVTTYAPPPKDPTLPDEVQRLLDDIDSVLGRTNATVGGILISARQAILRLAQKASPLEKFARDLIKSAPDEEPSADLSDNRDDCATAGCDAAYWSLAQLARKALGEHGDV